MTRAALSVVSKDWETSIHTEPASTARTHQANPASGSPRSRTPLSASHVNTLAANVSANPPAPRRVLARDPRPRRAATISSATSTASVDNTVAPAAPKATPAHRGRPRDHAHSPSAIAAAATVCHEVDHVSGTITSSATTAPSHARVGSVRAAATTAARSAAATSTTVVAAPRTTRSPAKEA